MFQDKKRSTPERFELSHALHTALAGQRLNHSAKVPIDENGAWCLYINNVVIYTWLQASKIFNCKKWESNPRSRNYRNLSAAP